MNVQGPSQQPQPRPQSSGQERPQPSPAQRLSRPTPSRPATAGGRSVPPRSGTTAAAPPKEGRLASLDAYRGFIMIMLAASGFGIYQMTRLPQEAPVWKVLDYDIWQQVGVHFEHSEWVSDFQWEAVSVFQWIGVSFWDLIQPAFMFMVGVAMPFSYARRATAGHSAPRRFAHAAWRALVLVLLGVFLSSNWSDHTNWTFVNVLCQIGLGYLFVYALLGRKFWIQLIALVVILVGYWGLFYSYPPPQDFSYAKVEAPPGTYFEGRFAPWSKNANVGHFVDVWLLNQFPRPADQPFEYNPGGYVTLNFVPSIATMLLGVFCGQLLRSQRRWWEKFFVLALGGAACLALGVLAGQYVCPIVKRIWTPSWVLFSGGWVIWMLAAFYLVVDLCRLKWLAFPLIIVGMNSIAMYLMGQLLRPWTIRTVEIHFTGALQTLLGTGNMADDMFGRVIWPTAAMIVFWLIALWMYRQKYFVRI